MRTEGAEGGGVYACSVGSTRTNASGLCLREEWHFANQTAVSKQRYPLPEGRRYIFKKLILVFRANFLIFLFIGLSMIHNLKLQPFFSQGIRERLNASVVLSTGSVKNY